MLPFLGLRRPFTNSPLHTSTTGTFKMGGVGILAVLTVIPTPAIDVLRVWLPVAHFPHPTQFTDGVIIQ